jgi:hypothetical protein
MLHLSSQYDWLTEYPVIFQLATIFDWVTHHPIISFVILLFSISILCNLIKAINHFVKLASLSILRIPLQLLHTLIRVSFFLVKKISGFAVQEIKSAKKTDKLLALPSTNSQPIHPNKQQRLTEIAQQLEAIQQEQNLLLQEAAEILETETIDLNILHVKSNS